MPSGTSTGIHVTHSNNKSTIQLIRSIVCKRVVRVFTYSHSGFSEFSAFTPQAVERRNFDLANHYSENLNLA